MRTAEMSERFEQGRWVAILGGLVNIFLGIIKFIFGILGHSTALIADSLHSFSDLLTDGLVYIAMRYGSHDADAEHPYGHGRIETAATMLLAIMVATVGGGIAYEGLLNTLHPTHMNPAWYTLVIALCSIVIKEGMFQYTLHMGKKIHSNLLRANAWHHRSDAASSIIVLLGISGAILGFTYLDALAALVVGILIIKMAWDLGKTSISELIDTGVSAEIHAKILNAIRQVPGVLELHQLRTRMMGSGILLDVHVLVAPKISVSEGHYISQQVHWTLLKAIPEIRDVTVHVDPEDDDVAALCLHLPTRSQLLPQLTERWQRHSALPPVSDVVMHYLQGKIHLELKIEKSPGKSPENLSEKYYQALRDLPEIDGVTVYYE